MKTLLTTVCLLSMSLLLSCVVYTDHGFAGKRRMDQKDHWIELIPGDLARTGEDKWYVYDGPGQFQGLTGVSCFKFCVGLPSFKQPPPFEVTHVEVVCNQRWSVKLYRLSKEKEERMEWDKSTHEIWVESQPSPLALPSPIPQGAYQIKIHYRLGDEECDAEWQCVYKTRTKVARWRMPRCQMMTRSNAGA